MNTKTPRPPFPQLPYDQQASSINARMTGLARDIATHINNAPAHSKDSAEVKEKVIQQLERLLAQTRNL